VIAHYDGANWTTVAVQPPAADLQAVWGSGPDDVYAGGYVAGSGSATNGALLHKGATGWSAVATPPVGGILGIGGSSADDVFAVGVGGSILHYTGQ
jgi:hypothetical protein